MGPVWQGGESGEPLLLRSCYERSLTLAEQHGLASIAFPSISTGVYGYPVEPAARIAIQAVREFAAQARTLRETIFCCFSERDFDVYQRQLAA